MNNIAKPTEATMKSLDEIKCAECGEIIGFHPGESYMGSTDGKAWHMGCYRRSCPAERPTAEPTEAIEQIISAWAFAHDIDGAARNDLFKRLLASQPAMPPEGQVMEALKAAYIEGMATGVAKSRIDAATADDAWKASRACENAALAVTNTVEPEGSITLDNASVQRLLDYGVLHHGKDGWFVEKLSVAPDEDAEWLRDMINFMPTEADQHRLERIASRLKNEDGLEYLQASGDEEVAELRRLIEQGLSVDGEMIPLIIEGGLLDWSVGIDEPNFLALAEAYDTPEVWEAFAKARAALSAQDSD